jgi:hypothetical protein
MISPTVAKEYPLSSRLFIILSKFPGVYFALLWKSKIDPGATFLITLLYSSSAPLSFQSTESTSH